MSNDSITYDSSGVLLPEHGLAFQDLTQAAPQLLAARDDVLNDAQLWSTGASVPADRRPLDAGFHLLPDRLLAEYREQGAASEIARIQATADRLAGSVRAEHPRIAIEDLEAHGHQRRRVEPSSRAAPGPDRVPRPQKVAILALAIDDGGLHRRVPVLPGPPPLTAGFKKNKKKEGE